MKVRAKHNIMCDDEWIAGGTVFEVDEKRLAVLQEAVEPVGYVSNVFPPAPEPEKPKSTRSRRKAKVSE